MSSPQPGDPPKTEFLRLVGNNVKVPVRSAPNSQGSILRYLSQDAVIEVKVMNSKGFYRLADESVNKYFFI